MAARITTHMAICMVSGGGEGDGGDDKGGNSH